MVLAAALLPHLAHGQESLFIFSPLRGDLGLAYDTLQLESRAGTRESERTSSFVYEELRLRERVIVYHPRFMILNLGAGIRLGRGHDDSEGRDSEVTTYNISANLLQEHPYSIDAGIRKTESEFENTPASITLVDQTDTSAGLRLKEELGIPFPVNIQYRKVESDSRNLYEVPLGFDTTSRDSRFSQKTGTWVLSSIKSGDAFNASWNYTILSIDRQQDIAGLQSDLEYENKNFYANLNGRTGTDDSFTWRTFLNRRSQTNSPNFVHVEGSQDIEYRILKNHVQLLSVPLGVRQSKTERGVERPGLAANEKEITESKSVSGGLNHRLFRSLFSHLKLIRQETEHPDFTNTTNTSQIGTRYTKRIPDGLVYSSYSLSIAKNVNTGERLVVTIDELHDLIGFDAITLASENVVLASVIVTDESGVITYVEGVDYRIFQSGLQTLIERIPGTSILNGQTVLIDYDSQQPVGDFERRIRAYSLGTRWLFAEVYYRVTERTEKLIEGTEADRLLLNPSRETVYGLILTQKLAGRYTPEVAVEWAEDTQARNPTDRLTRSASLLVEMALKTSLSLSVSKETVKQHIANDDSDALTQGVVFTYGLGRMKSSFVLSKEESEIGETERKITIRSATVTAKYGKWKLDSAVSVADEQWRTISAPERDFERESARFQITLRRRF